MGGELDDLEGEWFEGETTAGDITGAENWGELMVAAGWGVGSCNGTALGVTSGRALEAVALNGTVAGRGDDVDAPAVRLLGPVVGSRAGIPDRRLGRAVGADVPEGPHEGVRDGVKVEL